MTPYYQDASVTIYHGRALVVMDTLYGGLRTQSFDLLLTDPPYGLNEAAGKNRSRNRSRNNVAAATDFGSAAWDAKPATQELALAREISRWQIVFGGNYYDLPPSRCWLVWDKDNSGDFADCELAWTNLEKAVRKLTYRWNGMLQEPGMPKEFREHPTQKPAAVMRWALQHAPADVRTVLDPFMGSGTVVVEAKRLGKRVVGIEWEEQYCEIAARRCAQGALTEMFAV